MDKPLRQPRRQPVAGPAPTAASLREAALAHLARFAATETGLRRVLFRRVDRWAQRAAAEGMGPETIGPVISPAKAAAREVAALLAAAGAVDDAAFATARARRLARSGRSRRAIAAHLAAKGVDQMTAAAALPEGDEAELLAAIAHCRRRRAGPFAPPDAAPELRAKWLASLARAGFGHGVAAAALALDPAEAEARLVAHRRG